MKLRRRFFARSVHEVAPELVGATLLVDGVGGRIVEVEAYHHEDPAAHGFGGRTARNASMFGPPGHAYVYRSYGIHWCLNFVCEEEGASAVLIRALEPTHGLEEMRAAPRDSTSRDCSRAGPGRLCQALGITREHDGLPLDRPPFELYARRARSRSRSARGSESRRRPSSVALRSRPDSRFVSRPIRPTASLTACPGAAATPARGSWKRTRPAGPFAACSTSTWRPRRSRASLGAVEREPDEARHDAVSRLRDDQRHVVVGRQPPVLGHLRENDVRLLAGLRDRYSTDGVQRLAGQLRGRSATAVWPTTSRNVDLVRLAVRGLARRLAVEEERRSAACGSCRCRAASLPSRKTTSSGEPYGMEVDGNDSGVVLEVRQGLLHERVPDLRRERPAGDGVAVVLGHHRLQLARVPDPDGDDELRHVADEPRVAVVLGRAGLAGDGPVAERGALARALGHDLLQDRVQDRRLRRARGSRLRAPTAFLRLPIFVIARGTLPRIEPSIRLPPLANVE